MLQRGDTIYTHITPSTLVARVAFLAATRGNRESEVFIGRMIQEGRSYSAPKPVATHARAVNSLHGKGFEAFILEVEANCHGTCGLQGLFLIDQTALGIQCICYAWLEAKGLHEGSEDGGLCSLYEEGVPPWRWQAMLLVACS